MVHYARYIAQMRGVSDEFIKKWGKAKNQNDRDNGSDSVKALKT